jgi:hypothetical protein
MRNRMPPEVPERRPPPGGGPRVRLSLARPPARGEELGQHGSEHLRRDPVPLALERAKRGVQKRVAEPAPPGRQPLVTPSLVTTRTGVAIADTRSSGSELVIVLS